MVVEVEHAGNSPPSRVVVITGTWEEVAYYVRGESRVAWFSSETVNSDISITVILLKNRTNRSNCLLILIHLLRIQVMQTGRVTRSPIRPSKIYTGDHRHVHSTSKILCKLVIQLLGKRGKSDLACRLFLLRIVQIELRAALQLTRLANELALPLVIPVRLVIKQNDLNWKLHVSSTELRTRYFDVGELGVRATSGFRALVHLDPVSLMKALQVAKV